MITTPKTLTVLEQHQLLDALLVKNGTQKQFRKGIRNYTMALLMLEAGLRVGEVVGLLQTDLMYGDVPVSALVVLAEIAKNKTERIIPVSSRLQRAIKEMHKNWWLGTDQIGANYAFWSVKRWKGITTRQVERIITATAMKSLGRPIHPHILRHTFASKLMRKTNARVVQELLGHKHMSSTQIYTHPNQEDLKKAIKQMNGDAGLYLGQGLDE